MLEEAPSSGDRAEKKSRPDDSVLHPLLPEMGGSGRDKQRGRQGDHEAMGGTGETYDAPAGIDPRARREESKHRLRIAVPPYYCNTDALTIDRHLSAWTDADGN